VTTVSFDVLGIPAPQGSKTRMPNGAVIEGASKTGRAKTKAWRTAVAEAAQAVAEEHGQFTGPTNLMVWLRFPRPKSRPKRHHGYHTVRPDKDKTLRACLDGLTDGGLVRDDALICRITLTAIETEDWTGAQFQMWDLS
jgi:Holliday junction resolvase RusA-like endonuclease